MGYEACRSPRSDHLFDVHRNIDTRRFRFSRASLAQQHNATEQPRRLLEPRISGLVQHKHSAKLHQHVHSILAPQPEQHSKFLREREKETGRKKLQLGNASKLRKELDSNRGANTQKPHVDYEVRHGAGIRIGADLT